MCSRHAAHLIAEYEAARLASEENEETNDASRLVEPEQEPSEQTGVRAAVVARLFR